MGEVEWRRKKKVAIIVLQKDKEKTGFVVISVINGITLSVKTLMSIMCLLKMRNTNVVDVEGLRKLL